MATERKEQTINKEVEQMMAQKIDFWTGVVNQSMPSLSPEERAKYVEVVAIEGVMKSFKNRIKGLSVEDSEGNRDKNIEIQKEIDDLYDKRKRIVNDEEYEKIREKIS